MRHQIGDLTGITAFKTFEGKIRHRGGLNDMSFLWRNAGKVAQSINNEITIKDSSAADKNTGAMDVLQHLIRG